MAAPRIDSSEARNAKLLDSLSIQKRLQLLRGFEQVRLALFIVLAIHFFVKVTRNLVVGYFETCRPVRRNRIMEPTRPNPKITVRMKSDRVT
jgi:hypothetical protein